MRTKLATKRVTEDMITLPSTFSRFAGPLDIRVKSPTAPKLHTKIHFFNAERTYQFLFLKHGMPERREEEWENGVRAWGILHSPSAVANLKRRAAITVKKKAPRTRTNIFLSLPLSLSAVVFGRELKGGEISN